MPYNRILLFRPDPILFIPNDTQNALFVLNIFSSNLLLEKNIQLNKEIGIEYKYQCS